MFSKAFFIIQFFSCTFFLFFCLSCDSDKLNHESKDNSGSKFKNGDIIFHTSKSAQSMAIQLATDSKYSHCGIIYLENGIAYVFEAIQPVQKTPIKSWINRGERGHYVVKRLKNADELLNKNVLLKMKTEADKMAGKAYDSAFGWSDDKIYCSELVWKIYKRAAAVEIGKTEKLRNFNLENKIVKAKLQERYQGKIPLDETVISPAAIFNSNLLETVYSN